MYDDGFEIIDGCFEGAEFVYVHPVRDFVVDGINYSRYRTTCEPRLMIELIDDPCWVEDLLYHPQDQEEGS